MDHPKLYSHRVMLIKRIFQFKNLLKCTYNNKINEKYQIYIELLRLYISGYTLGTVIFKGPSPAERLVRRKQS